MVTGPSGGTLPGGLGEYWLGSILVVLVKLEMGLVVGERGWRRRDDGKDEGDLACRSDALLNDGVEVEYCSRALIWVPGCGSAVERIPAGDVLLREMVSLAEPFPSPSPNKSVQFSSGLEKLVCNLL